jgi:hypothetical protein
MKLQKLSRFASFGLLASVVITLTVSGCRRATEPPQGDTPAGQPMIPGSAGVIGIRAISELGNAGDFELDLYVTDSNGTPVTNLDPSSISIQSATDTMFSAVGLGVAAMATGGPFSAELLIDQSNSMAWNDPLKLRWKAADLLLEAVNPILTPADEIQLSTFNDYMFGLASYGPFTHNGHDFDHAVDSLEYVLGPGTPLYDAMLAETDSLVMMGKNPNKALIVFTDGDDNESNHSLWDAINYAKSNGVKVFAIALKTGINADSGATNLPEAKWALFNAAMATGGAVMQTPDPKQLVSYFGGLPKMIHGGNSYLKTKWHVSLPKQSSITGSQINGTVTIKTKAGSSSVIAPFNVTFQ